MSFKLGHVSIPKRRIFLPLFLFCAYDSSVLQNFKIFTHLLPNFSYKDPRLTEVTYHCINFNGRVRKVPKCKCLERFWPYRWSWTSETRYHRRTNNWQGHTRAKKKPTYMNNADSIKTWIQSWWTGSVSIPYIFQQRLLQALFK